VTTYYVRIPIAGSITIEVESSSEEDAMEAAWTRINENAGDPEDIGDLEWEYLDAICTGKGFV
jgi:hypothetical protein